MKRTINRRDFLRLGGLAAGGLAAGGLFLPAGAAPKGPALGKPGGLLTPAEPPEPTATPLGQLPFATGSSLPPNPLLEKLGFSKDDRVVILHVDDVGMCQSNVEGFAELVDFGLVSTGSVMVPCAWFPLAAHYARTHPQADLGVHLVLTSEWETIRWRPVSTADPASGLLDEDGYFHSCGDEAILHADTSAAHAELEKQILMALAAGIDLTHADCHQFVAMMPTFLFSYLRLSRKYRLPPLFQRRDRAGWESMPGMDPSMLDFAVLFTNMLSALKVPMVDNYFMMPMEEPEHKMELAKEYLHLLPSGITEIIIHATKDSPELRQITPDWKGRVADYTTWMSEEMKSFVEQEGIHIIGWRPIRNLVS
jgi:predicted glycoside hydrolase/deacetylase ChbG (UPF0249 family)